MLRHSSYIFDWTGNTIDEIKQRQHLNQYINIYLHRECCKTSFISCFIVTAKNLIWLVVFLFSGSCWPTEELYLLPVLLINSHVPTISGLSHVAEIYKLPCIFKILINVQKKKKKKKKKKIEVAAINFIIFCLLHNKFWCILKYVLSWVRPIYKVVSDSLFINKYTVMLLCY